MGALSYVFGNSLGSQGPLLNHVYISSLTGNDLNNGLSMSSPVATFAKAVTLGKLSYKLEKGSIFKEQFTITEENTIIDSYGSGDQPIIDARDVISGAWTKTGGLNYTYQKSVTVVGGSIQSSIYPRCFENGNPLIEKTSSVLVDATSGTCFFTGTYPNYTLYVRTSTNDSPESNGKTYSYTNRWSGIYTGLEIDNVTVKNITTIGNAHIDGSLVLRGKNCVIENCNALHGSKHNMFLGSGTVNGGSVKYASFNASIAPFVCFLSDAVGGNSLVMDNFTVEGNMVSAGVPISGSGILMHNTSGGNFDSATLTNVTVKYISGALSIGKTNQTTYNNVNAIDCITFSSGEGYPITINGGGLDSPNIPMASVFFVILSNTSITVRNNFRVKLVRTTGALFFYGADYVRTNISIDIDGMITDPVYRTGYVLGFNLTLLAGSSGNSVKVRNMYFNGCNSMYQYYKSEFNSLDSDYNTVASNTIDNIIEGVTYSTLAAYKTATSKDSHSAIGVLP